jgi:uncharacterized damage-inducible protein DinB
MRHGMAANQPIKGETDMARLRAATAGVFAFALVLNSFSLSVPGRAQAQAQSVSLQAEVLKDWTALKDSMHKIAAEMPADKYTFKPTDGQQTFGERVVHVATANVFFLGLLGGNAPKPAIDPKVTTKDAALKALDDSFDYGAAVLKEQTDQTLIQPVASPPKFLGPSTRTRVMTFLVGHTQDIYGQLAVYLRLNGQVPPASQKKM